MLLVLLSFGLGGGGGVLYSLRLLILLSIEVTCMLMCASLLLTGSEDCLFLNVWTPSLDPQAARDVMVYIHGGGTESELGPLYGAGLLTGSGNEPGTCTPYHVTSHPVCCHEARDSMASIRACPLLIT